MSFNIFTTLSKDNKELIHSAFLKFLLEEDSEFSKELLGIKLELREGDVVLEKRFTKKHRIDLLIKKPGSKEVIIIENKFKCFPTKNQLENYDEAMGKRYSVTKKVLLYFKEGSEFELPRGWEVITYDDVFTAIQKFLNRKSELANDKRVFITHYMEFLKDYIDAYEEIMANPEQMELVFKSKFKYKDKIQNGNGHWLNLIFHELATYFEGKGCKIFLESGSSYKPLINVMPWGEKFVIQLNGDNLKYYAHLRGVQNKQQVINDEINILKSNGFEGLGDYKGKFREKSNTGFVYREKLTEVLSSDKFTVKGIGEYIEELIRRIEKAKDKEVMV